ncbi:Multidrug efflux pump subunit AcrA (membrane-fusion protein) [Cupriavidus necator]|uniref:Efflux RND transporter periplasmic adaptor subunit n=1 Tax=Cupriavidus necator (strain ATCC 17699 / DSM 428 / KCTC 22496 / NCIMB 10442 / H16 / Stanier 337) TaxID=381666 RepID=Q0JZA4_CUPNH|nr:MULTISPECIES: efflux RND transporter periplasmic adaptor subunit [Cupriavidus]EON19850.1 secretion protein HlyD [Cupriavidus sp. GA3-3]KUE90535.1 transcriptional regulator [Cupriavidus necator]QCC04715.1 efflux RND transporter periplasmic adaptor subunit [Cupriavidus necator H16]QQB79407.1 efflux RND transporter periplasmic adaptor subunit [Cupriavidus necator]WKA43636.1 efflux RND transporter periplasmic adaptor subunit [Cupriavidus necator]
MADHDLSRLKIDRSAAAAGAGIRPRRRWLRYAVIALAVLALAGIAMKLAGPQAVQTATVTSAYPTQNFTVLNATGYVVPQRKAAVASKAQGRLEWLGVLEGSRVKKDEIIARLESKDVAASFAQAQAQVQVAQANLALQQAELKDAEVNLRRSKILIVPNAISRTQYDADVARFDKARASVNSSRAAIASAQANARAAEVAVEQTVVRAPFDGVVLVKHANVGDNITPFSAAADTKGAIVTIADMETLEVEADVAESNIGKIRANQPCELLLDALPGLRLAGQVSRIVPTVDRSKATVLVKVRFVDRDARVLPDMSAKIAFLSRTASAQDRQPVVAVQPAAVVTRQGRELAYVVKDGRAHEVQVKTGDKLGELVAVQGVKPGDVLVLSPADNLGDGDRITVAKP